MGRIGKHTFDTTVEIAHDRPDGEPMEVDVEVKCVIACYDSEEGLEVEELEARIIGRELTETEMGHFDFECQAIESFEANCLVEPEKGSRYLKGDDSVWEVVDTAMVEGVVRQYTLLRGPVRLFMDTKRTTLVLTPELEADWNESEDEAGNKLNPPWERLPRILPEDVPPRSFHGEASKRAQEAARRLRPTCIGCHGAGHILSELVPCSDCKGSGRQIPTHHARPPSLQGPS